MELPESIHERVTELSARGDALAEEGQYRLAVQHYVAALELLPEPQDQWDACMWLLVAIGDAHFLAGHFDIALRALSDAMHVEGAVGNPFIHLRLGQCQLELGDRVRAADELARAYMGAGKDIFEQDDPKHFEFVRSVLTPPAGGQW